MSKESRPEQFARVEVSERRVEYMLAVKKQKGVSENEMPKAQPDRRGKYNARHHKRASK